MDRRGHGRAHLRVTGEELALPIDHFAAEQAPDDRQTLANHRQPAAVGGSAQARLERFRTRAEARDHALAGRHGEGLHLMGGIEGMPQRHQRHPEPGASPRARSAPEIRHPRRWKRPGKTLTSPDRVRDVIHNFNADGFTSLCSGRGCDGFTDPLGAPSAGTASTCRRTEHGAKEGCCPRRHQPVPHQTTFARSADQAPDLVFRLSGWRDLNPRPLRPE